MRMDNAAVYDAHYARKRAAGWSGWSDSVGVEASVAELVSRLDAARLPGPKGLEVGCGAGDLTLALADRSYPMTGVDISPKAIEWANEKANGRDVTFHVGDARLLSAFSESEFDWVLDGYCWHFILEGRDEFLAAVFRVLRPGGVFMVKTLCGEPEPIPGMEYDPDRRVQLVDGVPVTYFATEAELLGELAVAGFSVDHYRISPLVPGIRAAQMVAEARKPLS